MTALDHPAIVPAAPARTAVLRGVGLKVRTWLQAVANRRHIGRLAELSDHQLSDIGLSRSDLFLAARVGLAVDPTVELREIWRRRHRRSA